MTPRTLHDLSIAAGHAGPTGPTQPDSVLSASEESIAAAPRSAPRTTRRSSAGAAPFFEFLESRRLLSAVPLVPVFTTTNLVSDLPGVAKTQDADLVNPWGVAFAPNGPFWVSDNGTAKSTLYGGTGAKQKLVVSIPGANGQPAAPTGQVFNPTGQFNIAKAGKVASPLFIFASEDGTLSGWSPAVDPTHAVVAVNHSATSVFKGLAMGQVKGENELFAANFRNGTVDVFGPNFAQIHNPNAFIDKQVPKGFAPFNIANVGGNLYVTYAKQDAEKHDDVAGPGNGYIDEFDTKGHLVRRLQHGSWLNSPWGMTVAPPSFGSFAGDLLVGNFGNGIIDVYDLKTGQFVNTLDTPNGKAIVEPGLWAITPGTGSATASTDTLYFTAGLNHEADGLFGSIQIAAQRSVNRRSPGAGAAGSVYRPGIGRPLLQGIIP